MLLKTIFQIVLKNFYEVNLKTMFGSQKILKNKNIYINKNNFLMFDSVMKNI